MYSSVGYAKWIEVSRDVNGNAYYIDDETIRKRDGYTFIWELENYSKPNKFGDLSGKRYRQVDCNAFRFKYLTHVMYLKTMGNGTPSITINEPDKDWRYAPPRTVNERILKVVCGQ